MQGMLNHGMDEAFLSLMEIGERRGRSHTDSLSYHGPEDARSFGGAPCRYTRVMSDTPDRDPPRQPEPRRPGNADAGQADASRAGGESGSPHRNFEEVEIHQGESEIPTSTGSPRPPRRSQPPGWLIALILVAVLLALGAWYFYFRQPAEPEVAPEAPPAAEQPAPEPGPEPATEAEEEIELPPQEASDAIVRRLAGELSSHPRLASWLATDELVRKFVATVDNVARGESPRPHLLTAAPDRPFSVEEEDGELVIDPAAYRRFDTLVEAFTALEPEGTARLYERLEPLIQEAYRKQGYPQADFDPVLRRAIVQLLETPVVEGPIRLVQETERYEYADPRLEELSPAQKDLLRTGPENVRRIQEQLRQLAAALGIPRGELPEPRVLEIGGGG